MEAEYEIIGQCDCVCHRMPNVSHIVACCHPKKVFKYKSLDSFEIKDRGTVFILISDQDCEPKDLLGSQIIIDDNLYTIKGVEYHPVANPRIHKGEKVGLLVARDILSNKEHVKRRLDPEKLTQTIKEVMKKQKDNDRPGIDGETFEVEFTREFFNPRTRESLIYEWNEAHKDEGVIRIEFVSNPKFSFIKRLFTKILKRI